MTKIVKYWACGRGHVFSFGDEDWHYAQNQGLLDNGAPVPMYCTDLSNCMDSSHLVWRDTEAEAATVAERFKAERETSRTELTTYNTETARGLADALDEYDRFGDLESLRNVAEAARKLLKEVTT